MELLIFLLIGAVSGWLAGQLFKGSGYGLLVNILVGIAGGLVGGWLMQKFGFGGGGLIWQILVSAGGAWLLLWIISLVKKAG
jgi:uncharacterized membrane protein YeaQ/YmgE (transglycosylase-associated protein family)